MSRPTGDAPKIAGMRSYRSRTSAPVLSDSIHEVAARVRALEATLRRQRCAAIGAAVVFGATLLLAFRAQDRAESVAELRARQFVLTDLKGAERATLSTDKNGAPRFVLRDEAGKKRIEIGVRNGDPIVVVCDGAEHHRVGIGVDGGDNPHLILNDSGQKPRLQLTVNGLGAPAILMTHEDGTHPAGLGIHADGKPWLRPAAAASQPTSGR